MSSNRTTKYQKSKKIPRALVVKSWPATIESVVEGVAGTRGSRYTTRIPSINTALRALEASIPSACSTSTPYSLSSRHAGDSRIRALRSCSQMARELLPRIPKTVSRAQSKTITTIDTALEGLQAEVRRVPGVNLLLPSTTTPASPITRLSNPAEDTPSKSEASPIIIMLEKKKGLLQTPDLLEFES